MKKILPPCIVFLLIILFTSPPARGSYKIPPPEVIKLIDARVPDYTFLSPDGTSMLLMERRLYPPISLISRPTIPLAGVRINSDTHSLQRLTDYPSLSLIAVEKGETCRLKLPERSNIDPPLWSPDSQYFAFTFEGDKGLHLCVGKAASGEVKVYGAMRLNNITGQPIKWRSDSRHLLVKLVPAPQGRAPQLSTIPPGPKTEETSGKIAPVRTYQNLLRNPGDEKLFSWYALSQPALLDVTTGKLSPLGAPGIYDDISFSPDGNHILVTRITPPFSYRVPFELFPRTIEIWDRSGKVVKTLARLPVQDEIPTEGVPTGPRDIRWQPHYPARLLWVEALDGGDPTKKVSFRERVMTLDAPFTAEPASPGMKPSLFSSFKRRLSLSSAVSVAPVR